MKHRSFFEMTRCPHCGAKLDGHMAVTADARPEPGDISICIYCAGICEYAEGLQLAAPSDEKMKELSALPELAKAQQAVRLAMQGRPQRGCADA